MLTPDGLLRHAGCLLAGQPDEADARRAISACYYALFDLLILAASALPGSSPRLQDGIRRSVQYREVRRVRDAIVTRASSRPAMLQRLLIGPLPMDLVPLATVFIGAQDARLRADYDLTLTIRPSDASVIFVRTAFVFDAWPILAGDPNTRTFLLALLFHERWTRRG